MGNLWKAFLNNLHIETARDVQLIFHANICPLPHSTLENYSQNIFRGAHGLNYASFIIFIQHNCKVNQW